MLNNVGRTLLLIICLYKILFYNTGKCEYEEKLNF